MQKRTQIIILAAGNSTRMKSETPKVLMEVGDKTMIERVVDTARAAVPETRPMVIVNERNHDPIANVLRERAKLVLQTEQLGTAHAVQSAKNVVEEGIGQVIVLYGDHPFIEKETIHRLIDARCCHPGATEGNDRISQTENSHKILSSPDTSEDSRMTPLAMVTFSTNEGEPLHEMLQDFGRIIRDETGRVIKIREVKDAMPEELAIAEKNPGFYCFDVSWLWEHIAALENTNAQGEYYLTDLVALAAEEGHAIATVAPYDVAECAGVNNPEQLAWARSHVS